MPGYSAKKGKVFDYDFIRDKYTIAKHRAMAMEKRRNEEGNPEGNPSTNVYELLEMIVTSGKREEEV